MKRHKYSVSPKAERTYNDKIYDSKLEMNYRKHLDLLTKATKESERVVEINEQVPYDCFVNNKKICSYRADFEVEYQDGRIVVVDCKGMKTPMYRLKKKLVEALFDVEIVEITSKDF